MARKQPEPAYAPMLLRVYGECAAETDSQSMGKPQSVAKIGQPRIYPPELFTSLNPIQVHHLPRSSTFREWLNSLKCHSKCGLPAPPSRGDWRETPTSVPKPLFIL